MVAPAASLSVSAGAVDRSSEEDSRTEWNAVGAEGAPILLKTKCLPAWPANLRGRVVLVEFWTYTCINWLRTLPYVRAWAAKYKDSGLVVIGVHTPEFSFEGDVGNVRRAAKELRVDYPIAVDSNHAIWRLSRLRRLGLAFLRLGTVEPVRPSALPPRWARVLPSSPRFTACRPRS